ncbi:unnamed protein product [Prorocentrum cordatum]|uniref:Major facilitator superfamily (MFS) profile domain-containing protein n=1 Tax=Prorocentrum cordatum TaxID=2364126 RepID=A0ABN9YAH8_9DINO|nr:unnamed protein product [Polarella glacialis]
MAPPEEGRPARGLCPAALPRLRPSPLLGCSAILVDFIGLSMIAPILPSIVGSQAVGNILTAQYLSVVAGQLAVAALADRFGRRLMIFLVMIFRLLRTSCLRRLASPKT